jgi:mannose-6-phosphate isomerase
LLKFIDARQELSVQVHPTDEQAALKDPLANGKTEAWVVLESNPTTSRIYAGFRTGVTATEFHEALAEKTTPSTLHSFTPRQGDCIFLEAGTVHAIGADILLFEVQQTSDITYRLYDWDRIDAKTGAPRELHIEHGLACSDFAGGPCHPIRPTVNDSDGVRREGLISCMGMEGRCRIVVCVGGCGELRWLGANYAIATGDVFLLPAEVGECECWPAGEITVLECGLPE